MSGQKIAGSSTNSESFLSRLAAWFQAPGELAALPREEVERIAHDIGMSAAELREVAARGPGGADLLHERLAAIGLSRADVDRVAFGLMRDLERDCACCGSKDECAHDLREQPDSPGWTGYCANAATLESIRRTKGRAPI